MQQNLSTELSQQMRARCLGSRAARLQRQIGRRFDQALAPYGLTMAQLELMAALEMIGEPVAPSALAGALGLERSTISRNLALLEERGLVGVAERTAGGRARSVTITEAGSTRLADSAEAWGAVQRETEEALGAGAPAEIDRWLERLGGASTGDRDGTAAKLGSSGRV